MFNSIQQFETAGIKNLRKAEDEFSRTRDMANFINAIKEGKRSVLTERTN